MATPLDEATDLLQAMIRNRCVNDGTPDSGDETSSREPSSKIPLGEFMTMFHGRDERIDQGSLQLMLDLYEQTARQYSS